MLRSRRASPPLEDEEIAPFYFGASPADGLTNRSAVAIIRPEEVGKLRLPEGWGTWADAVAI